MQCSNIRPKRQRKFRPWTVRGVEAELCHGLDPPLRWMVRGSRSLAGMGVEGKTLVSGLKVCEWGQCLGAVVVMAVKRMGQLNVMI